jgi:hypothetical protein
MFSHASRRFLLLFAIGSLLAMTVPRAGEARVVRFVVEPRVLFDGGAL